MAVPAAPGAVAIWCRRFVRHVAALSTVACAGAPVVRPAPARLTDGAVGVSVGADSTFTSYFSGDTTDALTTPVGGGLLAGGEQSRCERFWRGTALQRAVNMRVAQGYPIGGTSAGLAMLGELGYSARNESAQSKVVLQDPFDESVTFERSLFTVPHLTNLITDSHFVARDRMGRLLAFLGRLERQYGAKAPRAIAVDETSAVAVTVSGRETVLLAGRGRTSWPRASSQGAPSRSRHRSPTRR